MKHGPIAGSPQASTVRVDAGAATARWSGAATLMQHPEPRGGDRGVAGATCRLQVNLIIRLGTS
jgi:hypothetical protein